MRNLLIIILLSFCSTSVAQVEQKRGRVFFETNSIIIDEDGQNLLKKLSDSAKTYKSYRIYLVGNTDDVGDSLFNLKLSNSRVESAKEVLVQKGISEEFINLKAFGEDKPIAANDIDSGKQLNRRVDVLIRFERKEIIDTIERFPSIQELYNQLEREPQVFCINPNKDTVIRGEMGTLISIKANTFRLSKRCKTDCVTFKLKEDFAKSAMVLDNLTTTADGQILETMGMTYTEAVDCNGKQLKTSRGKEILILQPVDKPLESTQLFTGRRDAHSDLMNWTVNNNSVLKSYTIERINGCINCFRCGGGGCSCLFSVRFRRMGKGIRGIFNRCVHFDNRRFRKDIRICRKNNRGWNTEKQERRKERLIQKYSGKCDLLPTGLPMDQVPDTCRAIAELFQKYDVDNMDALLNAINKPLLDSFGVSTLKELQDTIEVVNRQNILLNYANKSVAFEDFQYFIYTTSNLGWANCDVFAGIPKSNRVDMKVDLAVAENLDCKIVFKDRRFVLPAYDVDGQYVFTGIPVNERAWLIALKYLDGQPYISMQEVVTSKRTYPVYFEVLSLEELTEKLKVLDWEE